MKSPIVSIIIPVFNGSQYIEKTIASIFLSSYENFEVILVDDGSTDDSLKVCQKVSQQNKNIHVYGFEKNRGMSHALNLGISKARGEYIARINQDDLMKADRLQKQVDFLESHPDHVAVGGAIEVVEQDSFSGAGLRNPYRQNEDRIDVNTQTVTDPRNGHPDRFTVIDIVRFPLSDSEIKSRWLYFSPFADPAVMYRKSAFEKTSKYRQDFWPVDDVHMWYELGKVGKLANLSDVVTQIGWHKNAGSIKRHRLQVLRLYQLHLWAGKHVEKPHFKVLTFWYVQLLAGYLLPSQFNWWIFWRLRRLLQK